MEGWSEDWRDGMRIGGGWSVDWRGWSEDWRDGVRIGGME